MELFIASAGDSFMAVVSVVVAWEIIVINPLFSFLLKFCKTNFSPFRMGTTQYADLKNFLEQQGFELLSHWYREGIQGEATFVRKHLYDSLFR